MNKHQPHTKLRQSSALRHPKNRRLMLEWPKGKRIPKYHRKMTKDHVKKTSEAGKYHLSLLEQSYKKRKYIEQRREAANRRFPVKMGGLKSLHPDPFNWFSHQLSPLAN